MSFPKIAIVGRPNVGKSALFNRLLKKRIAIVDEMEGVTRDRLYGTGEFQNNPFILIDTAGIQLDDANPLNQEILLQSRQAIQEASFCVLVVDGRVGLTEMDQEIARLLLKSKKPVCLAVNKLDDEHLDYLAHQFYPLGISEVVGVSANHGRNLYELFEIIFSKIEPVDEEQDAGKKPTLCIVGRTNVGKSTLINALTHSQRCVVSPERATTRDAIEIELQHEGKDYLLIDTAGIRRKQKELNVVEKFASIRTYEAIERSDICLFLIDAQEGMTAQEKKLMSEIYKQGKSCVLIVNKWDLVQDHRMEHTRQALIHECPFLDIYPILFTSALTGRNLLKMYEIIDQVYINRTKRIDTAALNRFIEQAQHKTPPPMVKGKRLRIYYMTQIKTSPPSFLFFVNSQSRLTHTYKRYLINQMRESFNFFGCPLQFFLKSKKTREQVAEEKNLASVRN
ncbi:MAG: GTPase Der [Chlamydiae bacterium]|nr:GTPase Der [Chlamydiota bacterium]